MAKHKHRKKAGGGRTALVVIIVILTLALIAGGGLAVHFLGSDAGMEFLLGLQGSLPAAATPAPEATAEAEPTPAADEAPADETAPAVTEEPTPEPTATAKPTPVPTPTPEPTPEPTPVPQVDLEFPYLLEVNKGSQIVTVFTVDQDGYYTVPVKYMLCSTGEDLDKFPDGLYKLKEKFRWRRMLADHPTFAQYCSRISGSFLFHSIPYTGKSSAALSVRGYNELGTPASGGCIRLLASECKWIYDNVPSGTPVRVVTGEPDLVIWYQLKPAALPSDAKWDPTDPDPANPAPMAAPGSYIRNTPYPGVTPAPLDQEFSKDVPRVERTLPPEHPEETPAPERTPRPTASAAPESTPAPDKTPSTEPDAPDEPDEPAVSTPKPATPPPAEPEPSEPDPDPDVQQPPEE